MRTVIGDGAQKQIRRLIAIVDMQRQVIIDSPSSIELVLEPVNDTLSQLLQIRRERNVWTVLGNVLGQRCVHTRMRRKRTPIDIVISGIDLITIDHRERAIGRGDPRSGTRQGVRRGNDPLRRHIKYHDLGLQAAGSGNGKPRANGLSFQSPGDRHARLKRNGARQAALRFHLLEHLIAQRNAIRRIGAQARNLLGIHAQGIKEIVEDE